MATLKVLELFPKLFYSRVKLINVKCNARTIHGTKTQLSEPAFERPEIFNSLITNSKTLRQVAPKVLDDRLRTLHDIGLNEEFILKHPLVLLATPAKIRSIHAAMEDFKIDIRALPSMLHFKSDFYSKFLSRCRHDLSRESDHRIKYLSEVLKISQGDVCQLLNRYKFVLALSYEQLRSIIELLFQYNVQPGDILRDPWVLRCKIDGATARLQRLQDHDIVNIKPWMVRCTDGLLQRFLQRNASKQKLLGESSLEEYLSQRLGCSVEEMKALMIREPALKKTSSLKMKKILDFLVSSGFSKSHIKSGLPRVSNRRIETINNRIVEMRQLGLTPNLYICSKSKNEYSKYINKWKNRDKINSF